MVPQRCLLRLNVVGATPDRSCVPLVSPAASPLSAVRSSARFRSNVPPPLSSFQKPLWRRKRPSGMNISHLCAMTQMSLRDLSTSTKDSQYEAAASPPTPEGGRRLFDTHAVVRLFEENGFSAQQAEAMVKILVRMTQANMEVIYGDMATKVHQELMFQRVMSQITAVKKDMVILEKSEFSALLAENEKLKIQILKLKVQLADMMNKVRSDTLLDMNLEKSHVKELKAEHEKKLLERRTELMEMSAEHDYHLTQTKMKIDTEVAGLKTMLESHKLDTIKYLAGSVFTCLTVILGFYRIWM